MIEKITDVKLMSVRYLSVLYTSTTMKDHAVSEKAKNWRRTMMYL